MNVYIPGKKSYMQGPCDSGFHVPSYDEWNGLKTIMDGLSLTTGDNWRINLHMPFSGGRTYNAGTIYQVDTFGFYWSSSWSTDDDIPYIYRISSSQVYKGSVFSSAGFSIRGFKNEFVPPTNSWTVIQGTLGSAGIFWNQTDGIISITSDGSTGYTIQDKNVGASTVYNNGDTLSEANCGKYYQRGNNYGFPRTGSVTTSSSQVNAQNYGPGNYYSSSTFIITSPRDSSSNPNLRGGVSGGINELKNDYIGEKPHWEPNEHTKAYFPLTSDLVDVITGNGPTATSGTITFTTKDGVPCASCGSGNIQVSYNNRNWSTGNNPLTWHMWCNKNSYSHEWQVMASTGYGATNRAISYGFHYNKFWTGGWNNDADHCDALIGQWALYSWTYDGTTVKAYLNGQLVNTVSRTYNGDANNYASLFSQVIQTETALDDSLDGYAREIIMEDIVWTDEEIENYYNYTKGNYGL